MKPWETKEWKKLRKEFLKDKSCEWNPEHKDILTIHHPQPRNSLSDEEYLSFKGCMVLCKRCAFAIHKGYILCEVCKQHYHKPFFSSCRYCSPLFVEYKLPCENFVTIAKKEIEMISLMDACDHYCGNKKINGAYYNCKDFIEYMESEKAILDMLK